MRRALALLAVAVGVIAFPATALAGVTAVFKDVEVEVNHEAIVIPGCSGDFVPMIFDGVNTYHVRLFDDGSSSVSGQTRETATWTEDGVTHVVKFTNNFSLSGVDAVNGRPYVFTITLHGVGRASDGTRTKLKLIGHMVVAADGSVKLDFSRGETQCGL